MAVAPQALPVALNRVTVAGPPSPMPAHKFFRGVTVNPATPKLNAFRAAARQNLEAQGVTMFPVLGEVPIAVEIWFCMRLNNIDFINGDRTRLRGDLNRTDVSHYNVAKPDVDNLVKFALDGLKGVAYRDDKLVVSVKAYRCRDNIPPYEGKTMCVFKEATQEEMPAIPVWNAVQGVI